MAADPDGTDYSVTDLISQILLGRPRAIGRAITWIENEAPLLPALFPGLSAHPGGSYVIGLTGAPGVGKSTTVSALVARFRRSGLRVGVLAVDPTSPFSGGALLGDRIRMHPHTLDEQVYIRSMATRGHLGGLAVAAPQALRVFDAAGFDVVLVETVGVGQSEIEVAGICDATVVLLSPEAGDDVQAAKAGLLEVADILVVNKGDREGGPALVRRLKAMVALGGTRDWVPPVLATTALSGTGVDELGVELERFRAVQAATGESDRRRQSRARREIEALAWAGLRRRFAQAYAGLLDALVVEVGEGRLDPYAAAAELMARTTEAAPVRTHPIR